MAIALALPGFNDHGRSVTPNFLLMGRSKKNEENTLIRNLNFLTKCTIEILYF